MKSGGIVPIFNFGLQSDSSSMGTQADISPIVSLSLLLKLFNHVANVLYNIRGRPSKYAFMVAVVAFAPIFAN